MSTLKVAVANRFPTSVTLAQYDPGACDAEIAPTVVFTTDDTVVVQPVSSIVPIPTRTCTVEGTPVPPISTSVTTTVPDAATTNGYEVVSPTPMTPSNASVVTGGASEVEVDVSVGDVVEASPPHAVIARTKTTTQQAVTLILILKI